MSKHKCETFTKVVDNTRRKIVGPLFSCESFLITNKPAG